MVPLYTSIVSILETCLDYGSLSAHTHQCLCFKHVWIMGLCLYKHQSTALDQTRSECGGSIVCLHVWNVYPCLRIRISFQHWVSNTLDYGSVSGYKHLPPASLVKHISFFGSLLCTSIRLHRVSNTFRLRFLVCVHAAVPALCFECVWIVDPCLCTRIRLQPCSNTFDYGCLFVYPPARTEMKVTPELERILHRARAPNQLSTFLEKEQLFGVDDVALVCTKEELLDETLIAPAKAAGVPCDSLAEKVCIKKVWALCREAFATGRHGQPASQTEQDDQVLPDEVKRSLDGQWEACHGFVLNTFRLLSETQQNKIYRMSHGAPRAFPIVLLESMRLLCRLTDGKPVKAASSTKDSNVSEEVSGVFELWTRLRAFFTTLAYTSIDQKDWFGFGECEQFVDQVFHWLHLRHSGLRAPIHFYIDASTIHVLHFSQRSEPTER